MTNGNKEKKERKGEKERKREREKETKREKRGKREEKRESERKETKRERKGEEKRGDPDSDPQLDDNDTNCKNTTGVYGRGYTWITFILSCVLCNPIRECDCLDSAKTNKQKLGRCLDDLKCMVKLDFAWFWD